MPKFAAVAWALGSWAALGTVALAADGTSARIGILPPVWILAALVAVACGVVIILRLDASTTAPLWLALAALLPWLPGPIPPAFLIFDGPFGWLACIAPAAGVVIAASRARWSPLLHQPVTSQMAAARLIAACLYGTAAWRMAPVLPGGDEPHYLIITQSLLSDGDLRIENNHARRDYLAYVNGDLKPDYLRRGVDGAIYSIHAPGLAVLVLPAFALGGYLGVTIFLALASAAGSVVAWRTAYRLTDDAAAAWVGWAGVALTVPFFFQSFTVYPDGPAALLVLFAIVGLVSPEGPNQRDLWRSGVALAALPWLHTRYVALAAALGVVLVARILWRDATSETAAPRTGRRGPELIALLAIPIVSAVLWLGLFKATYGTMDPRAPYGGATDEHMSRVPVGLTGLLLDQQFGLIPNAPIFLLAFAGVPALFRRHRRLAIELIAIAVPYVLAVAGFHMWWAGHSSPARFLVPVLLPCALPLGAWWARHSTRTPRTATMVLLGASLVLTLTLAWTDRGAFVYNVRDGYALWLDWAAPAVNLAHALPSLFQTGAAAALLRALAWAIALCGGWWALRVLERRQLSFGHWALGAGLVSCLTLLVGVTGGWAAGGRGSLEPGASVLRLAAEACGSSGPRISVGPIRLDAASDIANGVIAPDASRRTRSPQSPLWAGRDVSPGRYTVRLRSGLNVSGTLSVAVGRPDLPLSTCTFVDAPPGRSTCMIDLPAGAASLWLVPDTALRRTVSELDLDVQPSAPHVGCQYRAEGAVVSSAGILFVTSGDVGAESTGAWVIARATGEFVVQTASDPIRLRLRNGGVANTIAVASGGWHDVWSLGANESREIDVPRPRGRSDAPALTIRPSAGFRPADSDPTSHDARELGVWVELR